VDPDAWLWDFDGQTLERRVGRNGNVSIDCHDYFIGRHLARQSVSVRISAPTGELQFFSQGELITTHPLHGLFARRLPFEEYVSSMEAQALAEARQCRAHLSSSP
jgi:hypothetical protein